MKKSEVHQILGVNHDNHMFFVGFNHSNVSGDIWLLNATQWIDFMRDFVGNHGFTIQR
jgi:hypothetical protein